MTINTMPMPSTAVSTCSHPALIARPSWAATGALIGAGYGVRAAQVEVFPQTDRAAVATQPAFQGVKSRGPRAWSCPAT